MNIKVINSYTERNYLLLMENGKSSPGPCNLFVFSYVMYLVICFLWYWYDITFLICVCTKVFSCIAWYHLTLLWHFLVHLNKKIYIVQLQYSSFWCVFFTCYYFLNQNTVMKFLQKYVLRTLQTFPKQCKPAI